jgi:hypothetical protein
MLALSAGGKGEICLQFENLTHSQQVWFFKHARAEGRAL